MRDLHAVTGGREVFFLNGERDSENMISELEWTRERFLSVISVAVIKQSTHTHLVTREINEKKKKLQCSETCLPADSRSSQVGNEYHHQRLELYLCEPLG